MQFNKIIMLKRNLFRYFSSQFFRVKYFKKVLVTKFNLLISLNWKYTNNKSQTKNYSQTGKTLNTYKNKSLDCYCVARKKPIRHVRKLNCKQEHSLVCGFVGSSHVMIFPMIGHNTINIPEIFQVFTVSRSHCNCTFSSLEDLGALYFKGCYLLWRIFLRKTSYSFFWVWFRQFQFETVKFNFEGFWVRDHPLLP